MGLIKYIIFVIIAFFIFTGCTNPNTLSVGKVEDKKTVNYKEEKYREVLFEKIKQVLLNTNYRMEKNSRDNMPNFYQKLDILVVPSISDPLPTTVLEAMSCGKIVIGSNIDGIPEMLEPSFLFEPSNAISLESKLVEVINSFELYKTQCYEEDTAKIRKNFSRERTNVRVTQLLKTERF